MMMSKMSTTMRSFLTTKSDLLNQGSQLHRWLRFLSPRDLQIHKNCIELRNQNPAIWVESAVLVIFFCLVIGFGMDSFAQENSKRGEEFAVTPYLLESVSVTGSTRLDSESVIRELSLNPELPITDDLVMNARSQLLGLGIYKSVTLYLRKGTSPGHAILVVELEDEDFTIGPWAMAGSFGLTQGESPLNTGSIQGPAVGYRLNLVGRNLFQQMHRGSFTFDTDSFGTVRAAEVAYGLPRFAAEGVAFDTRILVADPRYRYLSVQGFGEKAEALWSWAVEDFDQVQYGIAFYANDQDRFDMPGFPTLLAGPKFGLVRENRLHGFIPGEGYKTGASVILPPAEIALATLELGVAKTARILDWSSITFDTSVLTIATGAQSLRSMLRLDMPVDKRAGSAALIYISLQGGVDKAKDLSAHGSSATLGMQHHSPGFIAEIALKIVQSPQQLFPHQIPLGGR